MEASQDPSQKSVANASMAPEAAAPSNGVSHCGGVAGDVIHAYRTFDRVLMGDNASLINISAELGESARKDVDLCTDYLCSVPQEKRKKKELGAVGKFYVFIKKFFYALVALSLAIFHYL